MAWFELHEQFANHPKVGRLAKALHIPKVQARGHLVTLWCWTVSYAQDGNLSRLEDQDISTAAEWEGEPGEFILALRSAGWLDPDGMLHDWTDHGVRLLRQMRERQRKSRAEKERDMDIPSRDGHANEASDSRPTDLTDHTDQTKKLVVDAPRRDPANNLRELKAQDYVLRLHEKEFVGWVGSIKRLIAAENSHRPRNPFNWHFGTGSFDSDMKGLIYRIPDEKKLGILSAAYNTLGEKFNWPNYVELAIKYTIRASEKAPIRKPYQFTITVLQKPAEIISARADGMLSGGFQRIAEGAHP